GNVERLLEARAVERVRLVEQREHVQVAAHEQSLESNLGPRNEFLDQHALEIGIAALCDVGRTKQGGDPEKGRAESLRVISADHAAAPREHQRLHHAGIRRALEQGVEVCSRKLAGTTSKRGTGTPAWRRRARLNALLRAAATASAGLCGSRSLAAASAATSAVRSSTPTTASGLLSRTPRASSSAATWASRTRSATGA